MYPFRKNPLRLLDRYLLRETGAAFAAVSVVLLMVMLGTVLTGTLDKIARGAIPAQLLFSQVGLRAIDALPLALPLAIFLGVLLAYGRLYRDSEMAVIAASGMTDRNLLRPVLWLALPLTVVLAVISLWAGPASVRLSERMLLDANRSLLVVGLEPGRFVEIPSREAMVYVSGMSPSGTEFEHMFVIEERGGKLDVNTAATGRLFLDRDGGERFLEMRDGFRVEGTPGQADFRLMTFERNTLRLPLPDSGDDARAERKRDTFGLLRSDQLADRAELHWRLGLPISALLLALIAVPLSRAQPREPRYGKVLLAVAAFVLYNNFMTIGRGWIADGVMPPELGLWWLHAAVLLLGIWLLGADRRALRAAKRA